MQSLYFAPLTEMAINKYGIVLIATCLRDIVKGKHCISIGHIATWHRVKW